MIDLHSHFLPQMDDGASSVEESILLLKDSFKQGVTLVVATPHCRVHFEDSINDFLAKRKNALDSLPKSDDIPRILLGAEVLLDHDISLDKNIKKLCIEGTNYMLIEFDNMGMGLTEEDLEYVYNLTLIGVKPIIAHLDRYPHISRIVSSLSDLDIIYQINASRFLTRGERKILSKIFKHDLQFVVSSDMHNIEYRKCHMKEAHSIAKRHFSKQTADMFVNNPRKIFEK